MNHLNFVKGAGGSSRKPNVGRRRDGELGRHFKFFAAMLAVLIATFGGALAYAGTSISTWSVTPTNHGVMVYGTPNTITPVPLTNGQLLIGSTGADPAAASITDGTGISHSNSAGGLTITNTGVTSAVAGTGISVSGATGAVTISVTGAGTYTVTAKTADYSVTSGDTGTFFTTTGASGTVIFTLPTAAANLHYWFYTDAVQTLEVLAGASTTIQIGGNVTASAGNVQAGAVGTLIHVVGISTTKWVTESATGTWTVN